MKSTTEEDRTLLCGRGRRGNIWFGSVSHEKLRSGNEMQYHLWWSLSTHSIRPDPRSLRAYWQADGTDDSLSEGEDVVEVKES